MSESARMLRIVLCTMALLYVPAAVRSQGPAAGLPLPPEVLLLPGDIGVLVGLDAQALFASAEYKALQAGEPVAGLSAADQGQMRESIARGLSELQQKTGVDLEREVDRVVVALGDLDAKPPKLALVALGRLNATRIASAFEASVTAGKTLERRTVGGRTVFTLIQNGVADSALVFLGDRALLFGTPAVVEAALRSQAEGRRPLEANTALTGLVGRLDPAASVFVVVGPSVTAAMRKEATSAPPPFPIPDALSLSGRFGGGFEMMADLPDEAAARNMVDLVRGGLAMMRMKLAQETQMARSDEVNRVLDAVQVSAEGKRARLAVPGPTGGVTGVGMIAAVAIPSLLRARVSANEAAAIGDIRTVISAEAAYESVAQGYGDLDCLVRPASCIKGYSGPVFLDAQLAGAADKSGYKRAFHAGPAGRRPATYRGFAYTATPIEVGKTGTRSFCGDATGRICFDPKGAPILPSAGACPQTCADLK